MTLNMQGRTWKLPEWVVRGMLAWGTWILGESVRAAGWGITLGSWLFRLMGKENMAPLGTLGSGMRTFPVATLVWDVLQGRLGIQVISPSRSLHLVVGQPRPGFQQGGDTMQEKRKVLEMVASGKITAEEGLRLLEALEASGHPPAKSRKTGKTLLIEVHDLEDDEHVLVRIPLSLIRWAVKAGLSFKTLAAGQVKDPEVRQQVEQAFEALNELDWDRLVEEAQELGDLVRVDSDEARVSIRVE